MAKKNNKKTNRLFDNMQTPDIEVSAVADTTSTAASTDDVCANELGPSEELVADEGSVEPAKTTSFSTNLADKFFQSQSMDRLTKENKEKLEQYDKLVESNSTYAEQVSTLTDKIDSYLAELDNIRAECAAQKDEIAKDDAKIAELQKTIDDYLLKISELTFENAKLRANQSDVPKSPIQVP